MSAIGNSLTSNFEYAIGTPAPEICLDNAVGSATTVRVKTSNRGGPRPGFGGPQPGSGRPRKPKPIVIPAYAVDTPVWCVFVTWGQAEQLVTRELARSGYETYMPMTAIRRQDRVLTSLWHTVRVPYLPGYGFIRLTQSESREPVLATRGIREVLRRPDGKAAWVRDAVVEKMREDDAKRLELPPEVGSELEPGTMIQISRGAFLAHRGSVIECDGVKTLVQVEIFGRPTPVWLDRVAVEAV
jgi:transcription antitermination factor NusG